MRGRESHNLLCWLFGRLAGRLSVGRSSRCLAGWLSVRLAGPRAGWLAGRAAAKAPGWMAGCQASCLLAFLLAVNPCGAELGSPFEMFSPLCFQMQGERERMQGKQRVSAGSLAGCPDPCLASSLPEWPSGWPAGELSHDGLLVGCHTTPSSLYMSDARKERGGEREREDDERERETHVCRALGWLICSLTAWLAGCLVGLLAGWLVKPLVGSPGPGGMLG